ncbi:Rieske [2Fe-2S] domain protein [Bacteriovorax sp. BSW11_IV]|uniref:aromatic ring-hydroxylating oxygenase subunit alpha n=1 Tax=Bacteriovorax sp. BSW11_IV TaxID=1353529 RepID=UPI00038A1D11|nr:aromatic ring-hydroxylating dioxygenase subunit alpha [Bacteriovorax sp. BSW11_IV]EQC50189.1 Rieske [2Fe-2S] domain protein [Bacteriovorax sp. BSW11_IV]
MKINEIKNEFLNKNAQPLRSHKIFNNWNIVTKGWYSTFLSSDLKIGDKKSILLNGHKLVIYRAETGKVFCLDAFCPHMGVDLSLGKVMGENLRCFFHHWKFNSQGKCIDIPCGEEPPKNLNLNSYAVKEKYNLIWVYPETHTDEEVLEVPALEGLSDKEICVKIDDIFYRKCHYHITMINGIDPQHLSTVHKINIDMDINIDNSKSNHIDICLRGNFTTDTFKEKMGSLLLGKSYSYSMKYADGCLASLTMMKDAKLFNRIKMPELHMLFSYSQLEYGKVAVRPIYVNSKSKGLLGPFKNWFKLNMTKAFFKMLQGEDGQIYDNIRFNTEAFLKMDRPVVKYIAYINRLEPSIWSQEKIELG